MTITFFFQDKVQPIMCSYKAVKVHFEMWGLQTKVEQFGQRVSRLLYGTTVEQFRQ